ncbi:TPA: PD-(D/E)XK nuclease-like domain-containing protein [Citrobacter amalonaticus]|uniref:RecE family exodeoxyribonuclease n=1 Tax=Citrobacter amalonaticus TaxID=35703 RepID=UPI00388D14F3|nr:PD-(D/E)XK nuclease-like domain-containing protein [Citrobacter amalonaticus]HCB3268263.1 PD-(D/E)XK nuclease-like domain-containing protein [Citrobacter amalonaticus]
MSGTNPVFLVRKAKKSSGQKDAVLWCSDDFESANATLDYLLIKSGAKLKDYFKAVATNFPVVNELPPEGELSLTFCDFYQLGSDNMTWAQIPGVTLPSSEAVAAARQRIVDGVDTETGEVLEDHTETFGNENNAVKPGDLPAYAYNVNGELMEEVEKEMNQPVARMSERHRILSQFILDDAFSHHVTPVQLAEVSRLELDMSNSYIQDMLLACHNVPAIQKLDTPNLWKFTDAFKRIFPQEKRHTLHLMMNFAQAFVDTEYIDRGLLVKEWVKGNRVSEINRTPSGANAGGGNKTDRLTPLTKTGLEYEIALGLIARNKEFDIYSPSFEIDVEANAIMNLSRSGEDNVLDEFIATCKLFEEMPGGMDYSRACNVATVKTTPEELFKSPFRHREYLNRVMTETDHAHPDEIIVDIACGRSSMPMPMAPAPEMTTSAPELLREEVDRQLAAGRGEFVPGISDPNDPKWVKTESSQQTTQPEKAADGVFDAAALIKNSSTHGTKKDPETTSNVQVQETNGDEKQAGDALYAGESNLGNGEEADTVEQAILNQSQAETHQNDDSVNHSEPEAQQNAPETQLDEPSPEWPSYFEPGRYEGVPNDVYHAANGISSTMVKDARVSLMYYDGRHVSKTIKKERSKVLDMGNLVHALALQPQILDEEFSIEPVIPEGALTTTATIRAVIDDYNNGLPVQLSADDIKRFLEEYNATLPQPIPLGDDVTQTGESYMSLPPEFQRVDEGQKVTAAKMKACIREYNATLPAQMKTSGSRDTLLEQLAIINPDLVAQEAQKPQPLKVSGTKADLIQAVKSVKPDTVFADELLDAWRENPGDKILVTRQQYATALAIQSALYAHPEAGKLLQNPTRAVEVSYFGIDDDTGLEIRVRPDVELEYEGLRIGFDLKTISMWDVKEDALKSRLHREITMRDYHLSAGMYCNVADLDKFAWIFVNKDEGYHWVAVVWASESLLELGKLEYRQTIRSIANAMDTGEWPAPITEDYTDELNDYDLRRLDALRETA